MIQNEKTNQILKNITLDEKKEVIAFVDIFLKGEFKEHWEVNNWISENALWDKFSNIRSINDHENAKGLHGIQPKFFAIVCQLLEFSHFEGSKLISSKKY